MTFTLGGEDFSTSGDLPAGLLLDLGAAVTDGNDLTAFAMFKDFFEAIVPEEDHDRFAAAIRTVGIVTMVDLLTWIVEESTGRPLPTRFASLPEQSRDGEPLRVVSLSPAKEAASP